MFGFFEKPFSATKAPRHQVTQSVKYQMNNLGYFFVPSMLKNKQFAKFFSLCRFFPL
jgi:hypothetical protein